MPTKDGYICVYIHMYEKIMGHGDLSINSLSVHVYSTEVVTTGAFLQFLVTLKRV